MYLNLSTHDNYYSCLIQLIYFDVLPSQAIKNFDATIEKESEEYTSENDEEIVRAIQRLFESYIEPESTNDPETHQSDS